MAETEDMRRWIGMRAGIWRGLVQKVQSLRASRTATVEESLGALEAYRGVARDLATARRVVPNSRTAAGLEAAQRLLVLDPLNSMNHFGLGVSLAFARRYGDVAGCKSPGHDRSRHRCHPQALATHPASLGVLDAACRFGRTGILQIPRRLGPHLSRHGALARAARVTHYPNRAKTGNIER